MKIFKYFFLDLFKLFQFLIFNHRDHLIVPKSISSERMKICSNCPLKLKQRCSVCGCFLFLKTRLSFEECPSTNQKWSMYFESR